MQANPTLYQINTRVWLHRFGTPTRLLEVPDEYWSSLASLGVDYVWLMGVWANCRDKAPQYALEAGLQEAYRQALPDWKTEDIIGSPYAIDAYQLHPDLGETSDLIILRDRLHQHGLKLILDFVPNHFHADSRWVASNPEYFLSVESSWLEQEPDTFFRPATQPDQVLAHGKDPNFAAWKDTVQVDYSNAAARRFMRDQLIRLGEYCDGVRCDMAMLPVREVFFRTWGHVVPMERWSGEPFWEGAIQAVRGRHPEFLFLAEVYWNMEWDLQKRGFDFTYDKRLLDRIRHESSQTIGLHLQAEVDFQHRSARFLENHDEDRVLSFFDAHRAQVAAIISYTLPGMRFFFQGQWEGRRVRLPVQLGREPKEFSCVCAVPERLGPLGGLPGSEIVCACTALFYQRLLDLLRKPTLRSGTWQLMENEQIRPLLAWKWIGVHNSIYVIVNSDPHTVRRALTIPPGTYKEHFSQAELIQTAEPQEWSLYPYRYLVLESQ